MAVQTGTATGYLDLLDKFRSFITGAAMGDQAWTEMNWVSQSDGVGKEPYLRGPGLTGDDEIFVQLQSYFSASSDYYNIRINGASAYSAGANPLYNNQPGHDGQNVSIMLWNQSTPYWFIANGRRFIIIAKVSTTYQTAYAGFILPYGLPSEYPYPVAIGGQVNAKLRWSDSTDYHRNFTNPSGSLLLRTPGGEWLPFQNYNPTGINAQLLISNVWPTRSLTNPRPSIDGTYSLNALVLHTSENDNNVYGEFQGVKRISGYGNATENTLTVDGVEWLIVQDGFRTASGNYFAVALE